MYVKMRFSSSGEGAGALAGGCCCGWAHARGLRQARFGTTQPGAAALDAGMDMGGRPSARPSWPCSPQGRCTSGGAAQAARAGRAMLSRAALQGLAFTTWQEPVTVV